MRLIAILLSIPLAAAARDIRLLRLEGPESPPARIFLVGPGVEGELDLPLLSPSSRRLAIGEQALELRLARQRPSSREPLPADAPVARIPAGKDDLLLILLAGPGSLGFRAEPVSLPPRVGSEGVLVWFNLQPRALHVALGDAPPQVVAPGSSRAILPPVAPGLPFAARLDLEPGLDGRRTQPFVRTTWVRAESGRHLSFVVADPDRAAPRIISVPDLDGKPPPGEPGPAVRPGSPGPGAR